MGNLVGLNLIRMAWWVKFGVEEGFESIQA